MYILCLSVGSPLRSELDIVTTVAPVIGVVVIVTVIAVLLGALIVNIKKKSARLGDVQMDAL